MSFVVSPSNIIPYHPLFSIGPLVNPLQYLWSENDEQCSAIEINDTLSSAACAVVVEVVTASCSQELTVKPLHLRSPLYITGFQPRNVWLIMILGFAGDIDVKLPIQWASSKNRPRRISSDTAKPRRPLRPEKTPPPLSSQHSSSLFSSFVSFLRSQKIFPYLSHSGAQRPCVMVNAADTMNKTKRGLYSCRSWFIHTRHHGAELKGLLLVSLWKVNGKFCINNCTYNVQYQTVFFHAQLLWSLPERDNYRMWKLPSQLQQKSALAL